MDKDLIESAIAKLDLLGIALHKSSLLRHEKHDPLTYPQELSQQSMLAVRTEELTYESQTAADKKLNVFRVYVDLGIRATKEDDAGESKKGTDAETVYYGVEATFRVDYLQKDKLSAREAEEFSNFNAVHNVWPFWREHVLTSLRNADLPLLKVALMRGAKVARKQAVSKLI